MDIPEPVLTINDNLEVNSNIVVFNYREPENTIAIAYSNRVVEIYREGRRISTWSPTEILSALQVSGNYCVTLDVTFTMRIYDMRTRLMIKRVENVDVMYIEDNHLLYTHTKDEIILEGVDYFRLDYDREGVIKKNARGQFVQKTIRTHYLPSDTIFNIENNQTWSPAAALGIINLSNDRLLPPKWLWLNSGDYLVTAAPRRGDELNIILYANDNYRSLTISRDLTRLNITSYRPELRNIKISYMFSIGNEIFCRVKHKRDRVDYLQVFTQEFDMVRRRDGNLNRMLIYPCGDFILICAYGDPYSALLICDKNDFSAIRSYYCPPLQTGGIVGTSYNSPRGRQIVLLGRDHKTRVWDVEALMTLPPVRSVHDRPIYARKLGDPDSHLANYKVFIWGEGLTRVRPYLERMRTYPYRETGGRWHDDGSVALIQSEPGKRGYNNERREVTGNNYFIENFAPISDRAHYILIDLINIANDVWPEGEDDEHHTVRPLALHPNRRGAPRGNGGPGGPGGPPRGNGRPPGGNGRPPGPPPFGASVAAAPVAVSAPVPAGGAGGPSGPPSAAPAAAAPGGASAAAPASAAPAASSGVVSAILGAFGASAAPASAAPGGASAAPALRYNTITATVPPAAAGLIVADIRAGTIAARFHVTMRTLPGAGRGTPLLIEITRTPHAASNPDAALAAVESIVRGARGGPHAVTGIARTGGRRRQHLRSRKHKKVRHHHKTRSRRTRSRK
jgi:hypothetical protein